jgi:hypothetical protein
VYQQDPHHEVQTDISRPGVLRQQAQAIGVHDAGCGEGPDGLPAITAISSNPQALEPTSLRGAAQLGRYPSVLTAAYQGVQRIETHTGAGRSVDSGMVAGGDGSGEGMPAAAGVAGLPLQESAAEEVAAGRSGAGWLPWGDAADPWRRA